MQKSFQQALQTWGPDGHPPVSVPEALAYCRQLARTHYENFPLVSWMLPRGLHQHFYNVYAWCRWSDDLADETGNPERSLQLLDWWQAELQNCFAGQARHPVLVALRTTITECSLPSEPFEDLLSAFVQDQTVTEYPTFADLVNYCRRSANPVGRIVLGVCGHASDENFARSDSICTGLQLANFWQDVRRDLDIGRVYLPLEDLQRFGCSRDQLAAGRQTEGFLELMRFQIDRTRSLFAEGLPLVERLPGRLQIDIDLFARGGLCILDRIEAIGFRVLEQRPVVRRRDFARLLLGALFRAAGRRFASRRVVATAVPARTPRS